jgi:hypothetical protein
MDKGCSRQPFGISTVHSGQGGYFNRAGATFYRQESMLEKSAIPNWILAFAYMEAGKGRDWLLLIDNCSCVILLSDIHVTMQNLHTLHPCE